MAFHSDQNIFVNHVTINVLDLERSIKYYQEVIGFKILEQQNNRVDLTVDGDSSILSLVQPEGAIPKQRGTTGLYHFAILVPHRSDLASIIRHFAEKKIPIGSSDHLVSEALYLNDPDGNGIEIYVDRDPSVWDWEDGEVAMAVDPLDFEDILRSENSTSNWKGLPSGTLMGHIHLHVSNLKEAEEFYTKGLGFEVVNRFGAQALFISTEKYHHHIALNTWAGAGAPEPARNSAGLKNFSLSIPSNYSEEEMLASLKDLNAPVRKEGNTIITSDPSGNQVHMNI